MTISKATSRDMKHLKTFQWKKGQSGNPRGRPKRKSFEVLVQEILDERVGTGLTRRETIARGFVDLLMRQHPFAMQEALKRIWPIQQNMDLTLKDADNLLTKRLPPDLGDVVRVLAEIGALPMRELASKNPVINALDVTPVRSEGTKVGSGS